MATPRESLHKAAVLLSSLPGKQRAQLLGRLAPRQMAAVATEMAGLREVDGAEREAVVREFAGVTSIRHGRHRPGPPAPFGFLHDLDGDCLLDLLGGEHPQTIALVLGCMPPRQAAAVLAELPPDQQFSVICRMAIMREPSPEVAGDVENGLRRRLSGAAGRAAGNPGLAGVVTMLNRMAPAAERLLLARLADADPRLVRKIRRAMFGADVTACDEGSVAGEAC